MVQLCDCQRGDIIEINSTIVVLVENSCNNGYIFTALPEAYVAVESGQRVTYGYTNSGYERVHRTYKVKRFGHIEFEFD